MTISFQPGWEPKTIRRVVETFDTGSEVVLVITNEGQGYAKFLGAKEGPHVVACEFIGTRMAHLFGLPTLDHAVMDYDGIPEIELYSGGKAETGPAWITRKEEGFQWDASERMLERAENRSDLAKLVTLDTWILNCDRYRPEPPPPRINRSNVFFSREGLPSGKYRMVAMDHTHAFTCGRPLRTQLANIESVKNETVFGYFPAFKKVIRSGEISQACKILASISDEDIAMEVDRMPKEWPVEPQVRDALKDFLLRRRDFVADTLANSIRDQTTLDFN